MRNALFLLVLWFSGLTQFTLSTYAQKSPAHLPPSRPSTPQQILLLFAGDTPDKRTLLTLNNNRPGLMTVDLTAYTPQGQAVQLPPEKLVPNESRLIELSPILQTAGLGGMTLGWLKLDYSGIVMELGAQLTLYPVQGSAGVDSPRSLDIDFVSTRRDAAFWLPSAGVAKILLTNNSQNGISVTMHCGLLTETAFVSSQNTILREVRSDAPADEAGHATRCDLLSDGPASALRATGVVTAPFYSAPIRFYDPASATFSSLTSVGIESAATSYVSVHNDSDLPVTLTPVLTEAVLAAPYIETLGSITLNPHDTKRIKVDEQLQHFVSRSMPRVTLTLKTDAPKGAIVGALTQVSTQNGLIEDIPLRTSNPPAFARGSYPLRWDKDYTNLVSVTNTADETLRFGGEITAGIATYVLTRTAIEPGMTHVIDVDRLKRDQVPDVWGNVIPKDAAYGKIHWTELSHGKKAGLLGRTSLASVSNRRKSSFSCGNPCTLASIISPGFNPSTPASMTVGGAFSGTAFESVNDVNGNPYTYPVAYSSSMIASNNNTILGASADPGNQNNLLLNALSPGQSNLAFSITEQDFASEGTDTGTNCVEYDNYYQEPAPVTVKPSVTLSGPGSVAIAVQGTPGGVNTVTYTAIGIPSGGNYSWTSNNSNVTLSNTGSSTVTIQGVNAGLSDVQVSYTLNDEDDTADQTITVQKPTTLRASTGSQPFDCSQFGPSLAYNTNNALITYTVLDQNQAPITGISIPVAEHFIPGSNTCAGVPDTPTETSGSTNTSGVFGPDSLLLCSSSCLPAVNSQPTGACSLNVSQTWTANGFSVQTKSVAYTCTGVTLQ